MYAISFHSVISCDVRKRSLDIGLLARSGCAINDRLSCLYHLWWVTGCAPRIIKQAKHGDQEMQGVAKSQYANGFEMGWWGTFLRIERNHLVIFSLQPPLQNFGPHCGARGKGNTIDPINRDLCALPSPLRPSGGRRRRRRRRGGRTNC